MEIFLSIYLLYYLNNLLPKTFYVQVVFSMPWALKEVQVIVSALGDFNVTTEMT